MPSITKRFASALYKAGLRETRERKVEVVSAVAGVVLYVARLKVNNRLSAEGFKQSGGDAIAAGVIAFV